MTFSSTISKWGLSPSLRQDIHACQTPITSVKTSSSKLETLVCGSTDPSDMHGYLLCRYHDSMIQEANALIDEGAIQNIKDFQLDIKDYINLNDLEMEPSRCEKIGGWIKRNSWPIALGIGASVVMGLILYKAANAGQSTGEEEPRFADALIGAQDIPKGAKKRAVYIYVEPKDVNNQVLSRMYCTGSALAEDTIVTAGHCLTFLEESEDQICKNSNGTEVSPPDYDQVDFETYNAFFNDPEITCAPAYQKITYPKIDEVAVMYGTETGGKNIPKLLSRMYRTKEYKIHPGFNITLQEPSHDIALIKLKKPIKGIPLSLLPTDKIYNQLQHETAANGNGQQPAFPNNVYLQAWGQKENPDVPYTPGMSVSMGTNFQVDATRLREVNRTSRLPPRGKSVDLIYTTSNDSSVCMGDSGGPVYYRDKSNNNLFLVGVTSTSQDFAGNCVFFNDAAHTNVHSHNRWIKKQMEILKSSKQSNRADVYQGQAEKGFEDSWGDDGYIKDVDCNQTKIEALNQKTQRLQQKAAKCLSNPSRNQTQACKEKQSRAKGFANELKFRNDNCNLTKRSTITPPSNSTAKPNLTKSSIINPPSNSTAKPSRQDFNFSNPKTTDGTAYIYMGVGVVAIATVGAGAGILASK